MVRRQADAVLVTVPLGVLKRGAIAFDPPLPAAKQDVIQRLGFGVLNKASEGPGPPVRQPTPRGPGGGGCGGI